MGTQSNIPKVLDVVPSVVTMGEEASPGDVVGNTTMVEDRREESAKDLLEVDVGIEVVGGRRVGES